MATSVVDAGGDGTTYASRSRPGKALFRIATRVRRPSAPRALTLERMHVVLLIAGSVLLPLGIVVILLGWYGAAHTPYSYEQTSYLISGGLLGLGLVFAGGFLYFGAWLVRGTAFARTDAERMVDVLERIGERLAASAPAAGVHGATASAPGAGGAGGAAGARFVATPTGSMMHRADCPVAQGRADLRPVGADEGLRPCRICNPLDG